MIGTSQKNKPAGTGYSNGLYIKKADGTYVPIVDANGGGYYSANSVLNAPSLKIVGGSASPLITNNALFRSKDNGILSTSVAANSTFPVLNGGNLATANTRVYTVLSSVNATTGAQTLSVVSGADFLTARGPVLLTDINLGDNTTAIVGFIIVANASGSNFVPGTTNLDASNVTTTFIDYFGFQIL